MRSAPTWKSQLLVLVLPALIIATILVLGFSWGQPMGAQAPSPKVGQGLATTLQAEGQAHIIIALTTPLSARSQQVDLIALQQEVSSLQTEVLSQLSDEEYQNRVR